jgi:ligand-binding sensor domain-containing protein
MKIAPLLTIALFSCLPYSSISQEYSYTHYDITEGLAGSTVYTITQDKEGFIWVGTETGVSRFDGTHFKNFTTADGLPDIEVLQIFGDSRGRVWMAPFRKSVCYYYKGKIYNQDNDSLLRRFKLKGNIESFAEDAHGNILIQERTALHLMSTDGSIRDFDSIGNSPIRECVATCRSASGHFLVQEGQAVWAFSGDRFSLVHAIEMLAYNPNYIAMTPRWIIWREKATRTAIESLVTGKISYQPFDRTNYKHISYTFIDDSLAYFNEFTGTTRYNLRTGRKDLFLPGVQVSRTFRDQGGSIWFTTLGHGIFRLNSDEFRSINLRTGNVLRTSVYAIKRVGRELWLGNEHNRLFKLSLPDHAFIATSVFTKEAMNHVLFIDKMANNDIIYAVDNGITENTRNVRLVRGVTLMIKSVFKKNDNELLLGTTWGVAIFNVHSFRITDTLWRERSTTVYYHDNCTYFGTMNGLYKITPDKSIHFLGRNIPFLRKRISSVAASGNGILWVASYDDAGVIGMRNDTVVAMITKEQGLSSDICRTLVVQNNILWIGTDKGLNMVNLDKPGYPVISYNSNDGLGSDMINSIYADSNMIYVGTPVGLSYFDETRVTSTEECLLYLLSVMNAGNERLTDTSGLLLSYKKNDIHVEFAAISYRSVGDITYRYRLEGLDTAWKRTKDTHLEYLALPSGNYRFQLQAINKFGTPSRLLSLPFEVATPFWHTFWFYGLLMACFLALVWMLFSMRVRTIRRRQEEKDQVSRRMTELEHKALQAQMNPHFIFNCLNSIQQYIFAQDIFAANKYITGFAKLIRATLNNSTRTFIPLSEEVDYLSSYLSLEKLRFKDKMDYFIDVDPSIDRHSVLIPPMLIQPYVENSMRHGLRHKTEGKGYIRLTLTQTANQLVVIVEDNGIGRERAAQYKTGEHIEYQSKGMTLTADRIRMMNAGNKERITVEVIDLKDAQDRAAGTRVTISFPLFHTTPQKDNP